MKTQMALGLLVAFGGLQNAPAGNIEETKELIDFEAPADVAAWRPEHDRVMGGVSTGSAKFEEEHASFEGYLSLENNGGFASFSTRPPVQDLSSFDGLRLVVRGDGQIYKLRLRTRSGWRAPSWQASFTTQDGVWQTVDLQFDELVAVWRGRRVRNPEPFDPSSILELGILISDEQQGPFALDLRSISAWKRADS